MGETFWQLGIVGWPLGHSLSPRLHSFLLAAIGLQGGYTPWPVAPEHLAEQLTTCRAQGVQGLNVTLPHKVVAYQHALAHTPQAQRVGAANTLHRLPNGGWLAHNTDISGFLAALPAEVRRQLPQAHVVVLGAGGAARAVVAGLLHYPVLSLTVVSRSAERAQPLLEASHRWASPFTQVAWQDWECPQPLQHEQAGPILVVNTTSVGVVGDYAPSAFHPWLITLQQQSANRVLAVDTVYDAEGQTAFCKAARAVGVGCQDGLAMLVHQGADSLAFWTGVDVGLNLRQQALAVLRQG